MTQLIIGTNNFSDDNPTQTLYTLTFSPSPTPSLSPPVPHNFPSFQGPGWITAHEDHLYIADEATHGHIHVLSSALDLLSSTPCPANACHLAISGDSVSGNTITTANYHGDIHSFKLTTPSALTQTSQISQAELYKSTSPPPRRDREESSHPHCTQILFNKWLLVTDLGTSTLTSYPFPVPAPNAPPTSTLHLPGAGCRSFLALGNAIYVVNELHCTLAHCSLDQNTGTLTLNAQIPLLSAGEAPSRDHHRGAGGICEREGYLYVTTRQSTPGIVVVVDVAKFEVRNRVDCGGDIPRHLAVVGDRFLAVACQGTKTVVLMEIEGDGLTIMAVCEVMEQPPVFVGELSSTNTAAHTVWRSLDSQI